MTTTRFCFFCGTGYSKDLWLTFECSICGAAFLPPKVAVDPQLTLEEAQAAFDKIQLTDKKAVQAAKRKRYSSQVGK